MIALSFGFSSAIAVKRIKRNPAEGKDVKNAKLNTEDYALANKDKSISKKDNNSQGEHEPNQLDHHDRNNNGAHANEANNNYEKVFNTPANSALDVIWKTKSNF